MPKLIIPNAYELYASYTPFLSQEEINARHFYNCRFLWLLNPGDVIVLSKAPSEGFLAYLAEIKQVDVNSLHVVLLDSQYSSVTASALLNETLIKQLKQIMHNPAVWRIQACYFNQAIIGLADKLQLPIDTKWRTLIQNNFIQHVNSKITFREIAQTTVPITQGEICLTEDALASSLSRLLKVTGQCVIKQALNASSKGNIGVSFDKNAFFVGMSRVITLRKNQSLQKLARELWLAHPSACIVEVYYPNQGSFTAQFSVSHNQKPTLIGYSEILMESRWVGVHIPPRKLSFAQTENLIKYAEKIACLIQKQGYEGYLCCDAILTNDNEILFTEVNVRPGAETHAYLLALHLFGVGYEHKTTILTHNGLKTNSFLETYQQFKNKNLLFDHTTKTGVIFLTVDDTYTQTFEAFIAAPYPEDAYALLRNLEAAMGRPRK